jgi:gluconolactonase
VVRDDPLGSSGAGNSAGTAGNTGETVGGAGGAGGGGAAAGGAGGSTGEAASGGGGTGGTGGTIGAAGSAGSGGSPGAGGSVGIEEPFTPFSCPAGPFGAPVPEGATPIQVTSVPPADGYVTNGFYNIEGPVWRGNSLLFSQINGAMNVPPSRILKLTGDTVSVFIADAGTSGLALGPNGELYGARHTNGSVVQIDPATINVTAIASLYDSKRFNSPNDLALRSDGNLYFSDPTYQAPFCTEQMPCNPEIQGRGSPNTRVYRVEKGTHAVSVVDDQLLQPNGVTLSLDENTLFVTASSGAEGGTLFGYTLDASGAVTASNKLSDTVAGDGMVIDCAGNLYIASPSEVVIMDPTGTTEITRLSVPASGDLTNLAFGGPEHRTLFVTFLGNMGGLYKIDLAVPGRPY